MTDPITALSIIIEFSVGLAGFSGIVIIFASSPAGWNAADKYRISNLLCCSFSAGLVAFVPIGLLHSNLDPQQVWRVSSAVLGCASTLTLVIILGRKRHLSAEEASVLNPYLVVLFTGGIIASTLIQFINTLGLLPGNQFLYLYFGMVWLLVVAGVQFYRIVFYRRITKNSYSSKH
ncbi:MAG: hypothetical protein HOM55_00875 [Proteobacteria bacterium]|jgi:hypothetical protein|nr:hypothetical protein [Pseudomonadota bacterium]